MLNEENKKIDSQERINYWLSQAKEALERDGEVTYSPFFHKILETESNGYFIAAELARLLIKEYARHDRYRLEVGKQAICNERAPQVSMRELSIFVRC